MELRAAAGQAVAAAAASSRPPVGAAGAAEETRSMERRLREERQAALAAQKRVCRPALHVKSCSLALGCRAPERTRLKRWLCASARPQCRIQTASCVCLGSHHFHVLQGLLDRRQRRMSAQPDMSGFKAVPDDVQPLKAAPPLKTPPRGASPEPSPPRSPGSGKSVTFAAAPVVVSNTPSTISSSSSGSRSSGGLSGQQTGLPPGNSGASAPAMRASRGDRGSSGSLPRQGAPSQQRMTQVTLLWCCHVPPKSLLIVSLVICTSDECPWILTAMSSICGLPSSIPTRMQREEEAARKRQIEKEFAMMEVRALMDSGLIPSRSRRAGSSRGDMDGGNFDPVASERARQHADRASASVSGAGARHYRRRSATADVAEPAPVVPRQRTVSEEGMYLERGRSAENGGIPAAATLAGLQRISPQPVGSPKRGRADPSPRASPPTTPSRVPSGTYTPAAAQRQPSPRSPLTFGAGASPRSAGGRMSPLSLSPSQSIESDIGRKAASAWTTAVDTMNTGRRAGGGNPRALHIGGAGGSSTSLTDSAASGQLDAQSGRSTPDGLISGAPSAADELQVCMQHVRWSR